MLTDLTVREGARKNNGNMVFVSPKYTHTKWRSEERTERNFQNKHNASVSNTNKVRRLWLHFRHLLLYLIFSSSLLSLSFLAFIYGYCVRDFPWVMMLTVNSFESCMSGNFIERSAQLLSFCFLSHSKESGDWKSQLPLVSLLNSFS
jgi:hypothetical protein